MNIKFNHRNEKMINDFKMAYRIMNYNKQSMFNTLDFYVKTFPKVHNGYKPDMSIIGLIKKHIEIAIDEVDKERMAIS